MAPAAALAQDGTIAGVVKDPSGAVLPGVTVEASSSVLLEKVRTVVTSGGGQYSLVALPPGTYNLTFTLPGFSVVRQEGIQLTAAITATINVELRVGALEETVTVTGESPIVDVRSASRRQVLDGDVLQTLPTTATRPLGNVSISGAVRSATVLLALLNVMVRVETPPALIVAGVKVLPSVGGERPVEALTVKVATAGAALFPLLVCNAPAGSELK